MDLAAFVLRGCGLIVLLVIAILVARIGGFLARKLRQPDVIGEIAAGLLCGPVMMWLLGRPTFDRVVVGDLLGWLRTVAEIGLVLYLVGESRALRLVHDPPAGPTTTRVAIGSFVLPLLCGALLAVLVAGDPVARGAAPTVAFALMVATSLSVTAVPVLARILTDRGDRETTAGRLALRASIVIDTAGWLLVVIAVGAARGSVLGFAESMAVFVGAALVALVIAKVARTPWATALGTRAPKVAGVVLALIAVAVSLAVQELGLTVVLGAVLVGLALPVDDRATWHAPVAMVTGVGSRLVPIFFVVTGMTVFTGAFVFPPVPLIGATLALGTVGKVAGGYLGTRWGGEPPLVSLRVGVLMNTRGLTELIVLQAGYGAGILSAQLFFALLVMALVTTALSGPLLSLLDRLERRDVGRMSRKGERDVVGT